MEIYKIDKFKDGWFVGNFEPSILKEDFEVGIKYFSEKDIIIPHVHNKSKEINLIIYGSAVVNDITLNKGDIFMFCEGDIARVKYLCESCVLIVRNKSLKDEKVIVDG